MIFASDQSVAYAINRATDSDESNKLEEIREFMYLVGKHCGLKGFNLLSWLDAVIFKLAAILGIMVVQAVRKEIAARNVTLHKNGYSKLHTS